MRSSGATKVMEGCAVTQAHPFLNGVSLILGALVCWTPDYTARLPGANHRAAASALSSGRVLKAIAAPGAALRTALTTASNNARPRDGRRTPAPITTQS